MPFPNEHAARITSPSAFQKDSFRRKSITSGVTAIMAKKKGKTTTEIQAYRFDKDKFTTKEARDWLKKHNVKVALFEKATGDSNMKENSKADNTDFFEGQWFEVFKAGTHTDSKGKTRNWTVTDLDKMANYDPNFHESPVVIGHPKENAPAFGWVEGLKREGEKLYAKCKQLVPEFVDMVKQGMFKKRSISVYPDGTLRHIGFLGATPPAIKGLKDIEFHDESQAITYEMSEPDTQGNDTNDKSKDNNNQDFAFDRVGRVIKNIMSNIRDVMIETMGIEKADKAISKIDLSILSDMLEKEKQRAKKEQGSENPGHTDEENEMFSDNSNTANVNSNAPTLTGGDSKMSKEFSEEVQKAIEEQVKAVTEKLETQYNEKITNMETALENSKKEYSDLEARSRIREKLATQKEIKLFCESLEKDGKLTPALRKVGMGLESFLEKLSEEENSFELEFGEGDTKKSQSARQFMEEFLSNLPVMVDFKEYARNDNKGGVDSAAKIDELVRTKMNEKGIGYNDAFAEVQKEHADLVEEYNTEIENGIGG